MKKETLKFKKYSGNGNDFIILENFSDPSVDLIKSLCNRHFGVGADGVLVYSKLSGFDGRMQIFNADGGEAEMCGNGLRCLVTWLDDVHQLRKDSYKIKTMNGLYEVVRREGKFAVEMSEIKDQNIFDLSSFNEFNRVFYINTGVPHLVFEISEARRIDIRSRAPQYRFHKMFPEGVNVNFLELLPKAQAAYVRTYERGVEDETLSCGTGLTACGLALHHWYGMKGKITLHSLGGTQYVDIGERVFYSGDVKFCFEGEYSS